jgi:solute carrier family 25 carnitine/acylcarnitine transporter 20/29
VYRSAQFAVYETLHKRLVDVPMLRQRILPGSDMEARVPIAGVLGATARTVLEQPIEYAKVKGQTGQSWVLREIYQGAHLQWARTGPMMTFWFCSMDACKRNGLTSTPLGAFVCSGGAALVGFWIVWPFETLKNQAQAGVLCSRATNQPDLCPRKALNEQRSSLSACWKLGGTIGEKISRMGGLTGLYRGILPGSISVFTRNGAAILVMGIANRKMVEWGLKD